MVAALKRLGQVSQSAPDPNLEPVQALATLLADELGRLRIQCSNEEAFVYLQALLGQFPSRALLRDFVRRIRILSVQETLSWLIPLVARTPGPSQLTSTKWVGDQWVIVAKEPRQSDSVSAFLEQMNERDPKDCVWGRWANDEPRLIDATPKDSRTSLLIRLPKLLIVDWQPSAPQSLALMAMGSITNAQIWVLAGNELGENSPCWPCEPSDAYREFLSWRALSSATGVASRDISSLKSWQDVRAIFETQGIDRLKELQLN